MKNKENKTNKIDKKQLVTKVLAVIVLALILIPSCSTFIYYLVANFQK